MPLLEVEVDPRGWHAAASSWEPQKPLPVSEIPWLQRVYLNSFWQCDQHDCTENTFNLVFVEVTEVG